ncbi:TetR family transcriptional regulator [Micromonosporaceae bacterium Da 78-11]
MKRQQRAIHTRQALVRAAAGVFSREGYARATLAEISQMAGVSSGALHFHFENKAAVAEAVHATAAHTLRLAGHMAYRHRSYVLQALTDVTHAYALLLGGDVVSRAGLRLDQDSTSGSRESLGAQWRRCVERLLIEGYDRGEIARRTDLPVITCTLVTSTTGLSLLIDAGDATRARTALIGLWRSIHAEIVAPALFSRLNPAGDSPGRRLGAGGDRRAARGRLCGVGTP